MQTGFAYTRFAARLANISQLSDADLELLARMPFRIDHFASHETILRKGDQPDHCCLLLQGYLCWREAGCEGGQITSLYVVGDMPDLYTVDSPQVAASLSTLGPVVVASVPHLFLRETASLSSGLSRAFSRLAIADAALLRNWIINLGSRDSLTRVAHLVCETAWRLRAVGHARDDQFPSPFTQSDLAAACGISAVHANRIIQELRRRRLLNWRSRMVTVTDWEGLIQLARFDPDYLRLPGLNGAAHVLSSPHATAERTAHVRMPP
ncbi:MAG: Crp/Fnr family transcriptional regulator [Bradyrhizobium sp.]|nr:Crp/Fnr family transcriptional regulator [Bradyrhizobium sp.]